jgi:hypothetical protein
MPFVKRGEFHMRTLILIAAMVLTSATAQAGDSRGLSTSSLPIDKPVTAAEPRAADTLRVNNETPAIAAPRNDTPRYAAPAATTAQSEPTPPSPPDTPRYSTRPAPVETTPAPATTATTTPAARQDKPATEPYRVRARTHYASAEPASRSFAPHHASYGWRGYRHGRWTAYRYRIIAQLHRYGIYW